MNEGRGRRNSERRQERTLRTNDSDNPWIQEKKKHQSFVKERAIEISTKMAKIVHESTSVTVFSVPITDAKVRQITSAIEAEIISAGIRFIKVEGTFDENDYDDKDHHILEKTSTDWTKIIAGSIGDENLRKPLVFSLTQEDETEKQIVNQWNGVKIEFHWVAENDWKTGNGTFLDRFEVRRENETLDYLKIRGAWNEDEDEDDDDFYLYPLILATDSRPPYPHTRIPCAVFLIDAHEILEEFYTLQANIAHFFTNGIYSDCVVIA
jgi:hypothetical protein